MKSVVNFYFFGIFSCVLYASFFLNYYLKPLFGDESLALRHDGLIAWMMATLLLLTLIYSLVLKNVNLRKITVKKIVFFAVVFNIILFFVNPLGSGDIFTYIFRGRIFSEYGQNPFLVPYINFPNDYFYSQIANQWAPHTAIYGPLFMLFSSFLTYLAQENLLANIILFKGSFLAFNLASIFLVWKITKSKIALFLYSWNPLINFELVNNAHNDSLMVFLLLLSIYVLVKANSARDFVLVWIIFWLSILIKFFTLILTPFIFLFIMTKLKKSKERFKFIFFSGILSFLITALFYKPFWAGVVIFKRIGELVDAQNILSSLGVVFFSLALKLGGFADFYKIAGIAGKVLFGFIYLAYLIKVIKEKRLKNLKSLFLAFTIAFAAFFLLFFNWFFPWYLTSLIALFVLYLGLSGRFIKVNYLYLTTFLGILYYIVLR